MNNRTLAPHITQWIRQHQAEKESGYYRRRDKSSRLIWDLFTTILICALFALLMTGNYHRTQQQQSADRIIWHGGDWERMEWIIAEAKNPTAIVAQLDVRKR